MHALLIPFGSAGDVNPFLGLAAEFQRRGHTVTVATNGYFVPKAQTLGLETVELGTRDEYLNLLDHPDIWHPTRATGAVLGNHLMPRAVREQFELVRQQQLAHPDLVVVAGSLAFGAITAGEALGVPLAVLHLQPSLLRSDVDPPLLPGMPFGSRTPRWMVRVIFWIADHFIIDPALNKSVGPLRKELGLPRQRRYLKDWIHGTGKAIGLFPAWYATAPDWPANFVQTGFPRFDGTVEPLSPDLQNFLAAGTPPIAVTFGSGMTQAGPYFAAAAQALAALDRRGIILTPFRQQVPDPLPAGVIQQDYVSLKALLPRCAALIHHGGIGTTSQALAAGIPQLIMPLAHDQPDNAHRIERLGVGLALPPKQFTATRLAAQLRRLLDVPKVTEACRTVARHFEHDTAIDDTVRQIEATAGRQTP